MDGCAVKTDCLGKLRLNFIVDNYLLISIELVKAKAFKV